MTREVPDLPVVDGDAVTQRQAERFIECGGTRSEWARASAPSAPHSRGAAEPVPEAQTPRRVQNAEWATPPAPQPVFAEEVEERATPDLAEIWLAPPPAWKCASLAAWR